MKFCSRNTKSKLIMQPRSKNCLYRVILSFLMILFFTSAYTQTLKGKVFDTRSGEPMTGATVMLEHTHYTAVVGLDGAFVFRNVPAGRYEIMASSIGYEKTKEIEVEIESGMKVQEVNIGMKPSSQSLEEVTVTTGGAGSDKG